MCSEIMHLGSILHGFLIWHSSCLSVRTLPTLSVALLLNSQDLPIIVPHPRGPKPTVSIPRVAMPTPRAAITMPRAAKSIPCAFCCYKRQRCRPLKIKSFVKTSCQNKLSKSVFFKRAEILIVQIKVNARQENKIT